MLLERIKPHQKNGINFKMQQHSGCNDIQKAKIKIRCHEFFFNFSKRNPKYKNPLK